MSNQEARETAQRKNDAGIIFVNRPAVQYLYSSRAASPEDIVQYFFYIDGHLQKILNRHRIIVTPDRPNRLVSDKQLVQMLYRKTGQRLLYLSFQKGQIVALIVSFIFADAHNNLQPLVHRRGGFF